MSRRGHWRWRLRRNDAAGLGFWLLVAGLGWIVAKLLVYFTISPRGL